VGCSPSAFSSVSGILSALVYLCGRCGFGSELTAEDEKTSIMVGSEWERGRDWSPQRVPSTFSFFLILQIAQRRVLFGYINPLFLERSGKKH
jgi:hypothetical protein